MASLFSPRTDADLLRLIAAYPLATIVTRDFRATPLPLLAEVDAAGAFVSLLGHYAASNVQLASIAADPHALVLFHGPQGYISPELVSRPDWAPTWNYAIVRVEADIELLPDQNHVALRRLITAMEAGRAKPWTAAQMGERYEQLTSRIVAFRAHVRSVHATFKLGQDEGETSFAEIVSGLEDHGLAQWMRDQRPDG